MLIRNFIILILFTLGIIAVKAQDISLYGKVYSLKDSVALGSVHIINVTQQNATTSDTAGYFSLDVSPADKLLFTSIGYESYSLTIPAEANDALIVSVFLKNIDYQIDTVTIKPFPSKEDFHHAFMNVKLPEEKNKIVLNIPKDIMSMKFEDDIAFKKVSAPNAPPMGVGSSIPLSLIFGNMDPANKYQVKKDEFEEHKNRWAEVEKKYSNEFIEKLTGLKGVEAIVAFKKFCNLSNEFIIDNDQYIIAAAIMDCYREFEKMN